MNYINHSVKIACLACWLLAWCLPIKANHPFPSLPSFPDTTFVCNDLVHVSVNENCEADLNADDIVEGYTGDFNDFILVAITMAYDTVPLPIPGDYVGQTLAIKAIHLPTGNHCWGEALIEDKWAPQIFCQNHTIQCFEAPLPLPTAIDNCDAHPTIHDAGQTVTGNPCSGVTITKWYTATDDHGNESIPCSQVFTTVQPSLPDFPEDTTWSCEVFAAHPNVIKATRLRANINQTGSGVPDVALGQYCPYTVQSHDFIASGCGETFTIIRTWTVMNWCTGQIITTDINGDNNQQLIRVADKKPPVIEAEDLVIGTNVVGTYASGCVAIGFLPPANVTDNCHATTQRILTPVGEADYINGVNGNEGGLIPSPGLPLGEYTIVYEVHDICGNIDTAQVHLTVTDLTAPVAVCDEITSVSLENQGMANVFASTFNDGSYDNCCLDSFLVRRMVNPCDPADTLFKPYVTVCCEDVGNPVTVVFRAVDCSGNHNDCMVTIDVEDKLPPLLVHCPSAKTIDCRWYVDSLELPLSNGDYSVLKDEFGTAEFQDNCHLIYLDTSVTINLDQCQKGTITRRWRVTDPGQNAQLNCTQVITVNHVSDWAVEFPADITVTCTDTLPNPGEPIIFFQNCELIAVSFEDQIFTVVTDACYKILRTWTVINWCVVGAAIDDELVEASEVALNFDLNADGLKNPRTFKDGVGLSNFSTALPDLGAQPDGFITYQQVVKVIDDTPPVIFCLSNIEVCIFDNDCDVTFSLPLPDAIDCSEEITVTAFGELGDSLGPYVDVPVGIYNMTYKVSDNCGNFSLCNTQVEVRDCKAPTPFCEDGIVVELDDDTLVIIYPEIFDGGSFDNCPGDLQFSFSADVNDTTMILDCFSVGILTVTVYITDAAGNQDFCITSLFVQDNNNLCSGVPLIAGDLTTPMSYSIAGAMVGLNGSSTDEMPTGLDGQYHFNVAVNGGDYTVTAGKNSLPLNGVTTFDIVLISKHILGIQPLDNPYKMIAADANRSNTITTFDLVAIRKLILQIEDSFPNNNPSWRFIPRDFVFPDPQHPFGMPFPEFLNFNNLGNNVHNADFIGVKVGDVNFSADPQL